MINKSHSDASYQTDLTAQLETRGVTHLIVTGYMSQYCVDITVRRSVDLGYVVTKGDNGATGAVDVLGQDVLMCDISS